MHWWLLPSLSRTESGTMDPGNQYWHKPTNRCWVCGKALVLPEDEDGDTTIREELALDGFCSINCEDISESEDD